MDKLSLRFALLTVSACSIFNAHAQSAADSDSATELPEVIVEGHRLPQVNINEVKSADVAEALNRKIPGVSLVRRSGIANDIILRGQKKDNINILIDNAKIHGACPNRMDPPTSHILTNNIEDIEVIDGPFDVENFGSMSGAVKVTTRKPAEGLHGDVNLNVGSWDYRKLAASISGGTEKLSALLSVSEETGGQYEDGDGDDFSAQIDRFLPASMMNYKDEHRDLDAYKKTTLMGKLYASVTDNQDLELSYTANRSDDILYPSSKMDALYDDSDIITLNYRLYDLGAYSDTLEFELYDSQVDHPMSNLYRKSSGTGGVNEKISALETKSVGSKLINSDTLDSGARIRYGIDINSRNWDGEYEGKGGSAGITGIASIPDVDTENQALFMSYETAIEQWTVKLGARYDDTTVDTADASLPDKDYSGLGGFAYTSYQLNPAHKLFIGLGRSSRVPDARELYFRSPMGGGMLLGNPELDETTNTELDLGVESDIGELMLKTKLFYSQLDDFIHYNASKSMRRYDNVDASIYGIDLSGNYAMGEGFDIDFGLAMQSGTKDEALAGQTDRDLAEIPPLKIHAAFNYHYGNDNLAMVELIAAEDWDDFDEDNGEQALDGWQVVNIKVKHQLSEQLSLTGGIDNLFDESYAISNTYKDLILLTDGSGDVMLMNEPGRYVYLNASYSF